MSSLTYLCKHFHEKHAFTKLNSVTNKKILLLVQHCLGCMTNWNKKSHF